MNVAFLGYRGWVNKIAENLEIYAGCKFTILARADVVLYYGWSKMIPAKIYKNKLCLILHPSPLPKYRGGSPLQHQIMVGETKSAVTIFRATGKLDAGDIYFQEPFSLEGTLDEIFDRIIEIGTIGTIRVLNMIAFSKESRWDIVTKKQDENKAIYFKRRKPEESELTLKDFKTKTAKELYDFIRALNDPYPNAFIKIKGKKLYLTGAHL